MVFFQCMSDFSQRLRSEIAYLGLTQKEFAAKAGINRRALEAYLRKQQSMPPADVAVKIARTLGVSVEYLVTGKEYQKTTDISGYLQLRGVLDDLLALPGDIRDVIKVMLQAAADNERKKTPASSG